jgi:DNA-binding XRE family transcriptional regulator
MTDIVAELTKRLGLEEADVARERDLLERKIRSYKLKEVRRASGITQVELAKRLNVSQNRISRLERGELTRMQLDTLTHYIEALGGVLHVEAEFDGKRLVVV